MKIIRKLKRLLIKLFIREVFKDIRGYEGSYQISNFGRVKSLSRRSYAGRKNGRYFSKEIILKGNIEGCGYLQVMLYNNSKYKAFKMATLVWDHFGDKPRNGRKLQVDHIDEDKLNNKIDNLQLLTCRENTAKRSLQKIKSSKYTGVSWHKRDKIWGAQIYINGKANYIGSFNNEYNAHLAYQNEIIKTQSDIYEPKLDL